MSGEKPCYREYDPEPEPDGFDWWCVNDHTGCLWNDGSNGCGHEGDSSSPLEVCEAGGEE
jgi:hypothetical protein